MRANHDAESLDRIRWYVLTSMELRGVCEDDEDSQASVVGL